MPLRAHPLSDELIRLNRRIRSCDEAVEMAGAAAYGSEAEISILLSDARRLAAALETAPPTPPSTSLVEAAKAVDRFTLVILSAVNYADKDHVNDVGVALKAMRTHLTAHPAADAPPSDEENGR